MRLSDDIRQSVVFIGHAEWDDDDSFKADATGFLVVYKASHYLVTCHHVAFDIGDTPFYLRINKQGGGAGNIRVDPIEHGIKWITNPANPDVDLAAIPFNYQLDAHGFEVKVIPQRMFAVETERERLDIGMGDTCYAVGLFQRLQGKKRNLPVVHRASIALMPGDELIPVEDWTARNQGKTRHVDGYLVECGNLKGLSGAPVVVRPSILVRDIKLDDGGTTAARIERDGVKLLGVWSASWDAPLAAVRSPGGDRVPVGFGTVVPVDHLVALLETPLAVELRAAFDREQEARLAAKPD